MKVLLFGEFTKNVIKKTFPLALYEEKKLCDYCVSYNANGKAFALYKVGAIISGYLIELTEDQIWVLDQWKEIFSIQRIKNDDFYLYVSDCHSNDEPKICVGEETVIDFFNRMSKSNSLKHADIHLLIPGYINNISLISGKKQVIGEYLNSQIKHANNEEFADEFVKDNERFVISNCVLKYKDEDIHQQASIVAMVHNETKLCVVDIYIPYISISSHSLLSHYCENVLQIMIDNRSVYLDEYLGELSISLFGSKRSLVFCYDNITDEQLLNLLANEENPMGAINGKHFIDIIHNNLAQYDTASVYASETTMVEVTKNRPIEIFDRINSQALEIFFVEMLLLQDAAVSRLNVMAKKEVVEERKNPIRKNSKEVIDELLYEMSYAVNFADYKQFYFPTVRVSAEKIAKAFGIDYITNKYEQNKTILERMIIGHNSTVKEKENSIKNNLLIIITLFSAIKTINEIINLFTKSAYSAISFWFSLAATFFGVIIYIVVNNISKKKLTKKSNKNSNCIRSRKDK